MKKILLVLSILCASLFLVSCTGEDIDLSSFEKDVIIHYQNDETASGVTSDITLTTKYLDKYDVVWTSDNEAIEIVNDKGIVNRSAESDTLVELTATLIVDEKEVKSTNFNLTVLMKQVNEVSFHVSFFSEQDQVDPISEVLVIQGEKLIQPDDPEKQGYDFLGWYLNDQVYDFNLPVQSDLSLYAKWEEITYSVSFDLAYPNAPEIETLEVKAYTKVSEQQVDPIREGYVFLGWYVNDDIYDFDTLVDSDLVIYAKWEEVTFQVSFDMNYAGAETMTPIRVKSGSVLDDELFIPTREGYVFEGWYLYDMKYKDLNIYEDVTLIARWSVEPVTVTTYVEDFQNVVAYRENYEYPKSQYLLGQHTSNGILWDYGYFKTDIGMSESSPKTVTIQGSGDGSGPGRGWITGLNIQDGISYLEFDARLPHSPESDYPQGPGNDKAVNVYITVSIVQNGQVVYSSKDFNRTRQFSSDEEANKGKKFIFDDINIKGEFDLTIEVSSGHRATIANLLWKDNKSVAEEDKVLIQKIDFNDLQMDQYNSTDLTLNLNGFDYVVKEMWANNKNIHPDKELPYLTDDNGEGIARLRGNSTKIDSTPLAYIYNVDYIDKLTSISFEARKFGTEYYPGIGKINVYYQEMDSTEWVLIAFDNELTLEFKEFNIDIYKENVRIKFEASEGTINIDNIEFYQ